MPILVNDLSGISEGIQSAGSSLARALEQRAERRLKNAQTQQKTQRLDNFLENMQAQGGEMGTLAATLKGLGPEMAMPLLQTAFKNIGKRNTEISPYEKTIQTKAAEKVSAAMEKLPEVQSANNSLDRLEQLIDSTSGISGYGKLAVGSQDIQEMTGLGLTAIEPALDILNPRGAIPIRKIELIKDALAVKPSDYARVNKGKVAALRFLNDQSIKHLSKFLELNEKYKGNIPSSVLVKWEKESESLMDNTIKQVKNLDDSNGSTNAASFKPTKDNAAKFKGRKIRNLETNEVLISNGSRWIKER